MDAEIGADGGPIAARPADPVPPVLDGVAEATALRWPFAPLEPAAGKTIHATLTLSFQASDRACDTPPERTITLKPPFEVQVAARSPVCSLPATVTTEATRKP